MTEKKYCYACRSHHEVDAMALIHTKRGQRWRCKQSIQESKAPPEIRDAFGRMQTEINRSSASRAADFLTSLSRLRCSPF
ncbi:MAG: hypothetical protein RIR18_152 [Pseudomonadota bacterium]|jgi:hypothetical protein